MGEIMKLITGYRGSFIKMNYVEGKRYELIYDIPLGEILYTFFDQLKTVSQGYATMEYEITGNIKGNLVKVDILLNGEKVDAFSFISHVDFASVKGRRIVEKLKEFIPRQQFEVPVQAVIGGKVIARETIKSMGKNVLAKCYGGDKTRQMKLLEAQKEGKKRLKAIGKVSLPNDIFIKILKSK
jgi:GTP-binding protein LepA